MAVEAGHRRDVGVHARVRFAEGCLQGRRDAGSAGETEAAAMVVLAAVVAGTVAGGKGELARAVTVQPPAVLAPPVVEVGVVASSDSAVGGGTAITPAPPVQPLPPTAADPQDVQGGVAETAGEAGGDSTAGGISLDAPAPAPQPSLPVAVDPPTDQGEELDGLAGVAAADTKLDAVLAVLGRAPGCGEGRHLPVRSGGGAGVRLDDGVTAQGGGQHARGR